MIERGEKDYKNLSSFPFYLYKINSLRIDITINIIPNHKHILLNVKPIVHLNITKSTSIISGFQPISCQKLSSYGPTYWLANIKISPNMNSTADFTNIFIHFQVLSK